MGNGHPRRRMYVPVLVITLEIIYWSKKTSSTPDAILNTDGLFISICDLAKPAKPAKRTKRAVAQQGP